MKKRFIGFMLIALSFVAFPNTTMAIEKDPAPKTIETTEEMPAEVREMIDRINEIKAMDKSELSREERKALRKEVREIKKEVRASGNGLYISSGAIIIILLLIIIL